MIRKILTIIIMEAIIIATAACSSFSTNNNLLDKATNKVVDYKKAALLNVELGRKYLETGYVERAKKKFVHALELMPKLAECHSGMGYFWETVGEYKEAEKHYLKSISLGGGQGVFYNQYAVFLCERGRYKEAENNFILSTKDKMYLKISEVYSNAGLCSLKNNDRPKAIQYLTKAFQHDPQRTGLLLELAKISIQQEDFNIAKYQLDQFYNSNNNKPTPLYLWLSIKVAKALGQENIVASKGLLLKGLFSDSVEYNMYKNEYEQG